MTFQERAKAKRRELNLTQLELAEKLGYKTSVLVSKVENGTRILSAEELSKYADALGTTPEELVGDEADVSADVAAPDRQAEEPDAKPDQPVEEAEEPKKDEPYQAQPAVTPTYRAETVIKRPPSTLAILSFVLVLVLFFCFGTAFFIGAGEIVLLKKSGRTVVFEQAETPAHDYTSNQDGTLDTAALAAKVLPSVVYIEYASSASAGSGSGVFMTSDGWILTCGHVISNVEYASQITVRTNDYSEYTAKEFYYDSSTDTGLIKIEGSFTAAEIGDSSKLVAGETVVAVGTPIDEAFFQTVTTGVVSAVRENYDFSSLGLILTVVQHSAAINEGSSGGPLFNAYGQLVGINTIRMTGSYDGVAFALLSNDVVRYAQDLIQYGKVNRPMIGITGSSSLTAVGVTVEALTEGGCAAEAGIQLGDIITAVDGIRVRGISQLISYLTQNTAAGDTVTLTVERGEETLEIEVLLKASIDLNY